MGEKISEGAQADIYEAGWGSCRFQYVAKMMKGDAPLKAFHAQWPIGMLSARAGPKKLFDMALISIQGGTLLRDEMKGRFAFIMARWWGDLRLLIDRRMKQVRTTIGPFRMEQIIQSISKRAKDMEGIHTKHDIIH